MINEQEKLEIDGRINALANQRNSALNDMVVMAGQMEVLRRELTAALDRIKELEASSDKPESKSGTRSRIPEKSNGKAATA